MKAVVYLLFFVLLILHQDKWFWGDDQLIFGFLPIALAYHAVFSLACVGLGILAIKFLWPHELEKQAEESGE
ncbi:MAG: hypothetical protein ACI8UO_002195 [Verrucomicrobiales bacterium]|jgi:hypothetical protein